MTVSSRRKKIEGNALPSTTSDAAPVYRNAKNRRGKNQKWMLVLVAVILVSATICVLVSGNGGSGNGWRHLSKISDRLHQHHHHHHVRKHDQHEKEHGTHHHKLKEHESGTHHHHHHHHKKHEQEQEHDTHHHIHKHKKHSSTQVHDYHNNGCYGIDIHAISGRKPNPSQICMNDESLFPRSWGVPDDIELPFVDPGGPWTDEEQALADEAVNKGLEELVSFFDAASEEQVLELGTDAANSVYDYVIGSGNMPDFHKKALKVAIKVLKISAQELVHEEADASCDNMYQKATFSGYAHRLSSEAPKDQELKKIRDTLVENLNESVEECGSLDMVMNDGVEVVPWREAMKSQDQIQDEVYGWNMWTHTLTNCLAISDVKLPDETELFVASAWRYFEHYDLPGYEDYKEKEDPRGSFLDMGNLATHLQFVPTGYGRHYAYVEDAPWLYHYYRENFYASFEAGGHDLMSEFIDMLMTYGCTPQNDVHVRYGMRHMLHLYKESGHSFVHEFSDEQLDDVSLYDYIHKPWTGIASLMTRSCFEAEEPGSYGHAFRKALKARSII